MNNPEMYSNNNGKRRNTSLIKYILIWCAILAIIIFFIFKSFYNTSSKEYTWNIDQMENALTNNTESIDNSSDKVADKYNFKVTNVKSVSVTFDSILSKVVVVYNYTSEVNGKSITYQAKATTTWLSYNEEATSRIENAITKFDGIMKDNNISSDTYSITYTDGTAPTFWSYVITLLPTLIIVIGGIFLIRSFLKAQNSQNNSSFDFGKSKARLEDASKIRFSDVAGCEDEKEEMKEIVDYLKNPSKYAKAGARVPKGIILKGNPGTGKTLLAKAVAGEASVPFYYISGSDFLEMFVGVGASRVRDMFKKARQTAPCIIFIDEIDAIGRQRGTGLGGGHDEREQTLNQMLVEMDGFEGNSGVIVLAATNRIDILDPALLRPGRFDRQIEVSLPDLQGRIAILKVHARNKQLASDISLESVAKRTPGFSGAELENVLNEAAILSVRAKHERISSNDIDEAIDRVMAGPAKKTRVISEHSKTITAYHEAGHAVIGLKVANAEVVQKITIIPRGDAYGYVMMTPKDESVNQTKTELEAKIVSYLAGRASEEIFFEDVTTGAYDDIKRATKIARVMVTELGMSNLGPIHYEDNQQQVFLGRDYGQANMSDKLASEIDVEVRSIIFKCLEKAKEVINENRDLLELIAKALIKYETITADEVDFLVKYGSLDAYDAYKQNSESLAKKANNAEKPVEEKQTEEKPVEEKQTEEKPVEEKQTEEKPVEEKQAEEKPVEENNDKESDNNE